MFEEIITGDYPECPYCGNKDEDYWEQMPGQEIEFEGDLDCGSCGKVYWAEMSTSITFVTTKKSG